MKKIYYIIIALFLFSFHVKAQDTTAEIEETKSRILNLQASETDVITNEQQLPGFLTDFENGAKYYRVNYNPVLQELTKVVLIRADLNFLGNIVQIDGKKEIWLNSVLLQYPYLYEFIFYRQMGKLYGLEEQEGGSLTNIMTDRWEINPTYENHAYRLQQHHTWKKIFFEKIQQKFPLEKQL